MPITAPEYITIHLGPPDEEADNITVPFQNYLKNVASGELYPTWPENALRANIINEATFALNRVFNEYYRSRGYNFDITGSPAYDLDYSPDRAVFENISRLSDELFNDYITEKDSVYPLDIKRCNGDNEPCEEVDRWGAVRLAEEGLSPFSILQYYLGEDIDIIRNAPVGSPDISYPGAPLKPGSAGENVRTMQYMLNRISDNYPSIPKIPDIYGIYDIDTEAAVVKFQNEFSLHPDGVADEATWYRILSIYNSVKQLYDLTSERVTEEEAQRASASVLSPGDESENVRTLQRYLALISFFNDALPHIQADGIFRQDTERAVRLFQEEYSLPATGIVNGATWNRLYEVYSGIIKTVPPAGRVSSAQIYPGIALSRGMEGPEVRDLQSHLYRASRNNPDIPSAPLSGTFCPQTESAVKAIQRLNSLNEDGVVDSVTWNAVVHAGNA